MTHRRLTPPARLRTRSMLTVLLAWMLAATALVAFPASSANAASTELVRNYTFANGTTDWRTNGGGQKLVQVKVGGVKVGRVTTASTQTAVLNDATNTVSNTGSIGKTYQVKARVRTSTPGIKGALRVREVKGAAAKTNESSFSLNNTSWKTVYLTVKTTKSNASLDINVAAWKLKPGKTLFVDFVSMKQSSGTVPAPQPNPAPAPTPAPGPNACEGTPSDYTRFGASINTTTLSTQESVNQLDSAFGRNDAVRVFDSGLPSKWSKSSWTPLKNRTLVVSFRPSPQSVLSGQHDAYLRDWFRNAPTDQPIFWSYIHEPEPKIDDREFTAEQYKSAWRRINNLAEESCKPNMHSTLILTGWTAMPQSKRDYKLYDAGKDVIDVIAWDPYNGAVDPNRDYYDDISNFLVPAGETMKRDGRPWGIAETGSRLAAGDNGQGRAAWLRDVGNYAINNDASFVTYFQSADRGDFRLSDSYSTQAWREFVAR